MSDIKGLPFELLQLRLLISGQHFGELFVASRVHLGHLLLHLFEIRTLATSGTTTSAEATAREQFALFIGKFFADRRELLLLFFAEFQRRNHLGILVGLSTSRLDVNLLQSIALSGLEQLVELRLEFVSHLLHTLGHLFACLCTFFFRLIASTETACEERLHFFANLLAQRLDVADLFIAQIQFFLDRFVGRQHQRTRASATKATAEAPESTLPATGTLSKRHRGTHQYRHRSDPSTQSQHDKLSL